MGKIKYLLKRFWNYLRGYHVDLLTEEEIAKFQKDVTEWYPQAVTSPRMNILGLIRRNRMSYRREAISKAEIGEPITVLLRKIEDVSNNND